MEKEVKNIKTIFLMDESFNFNETKKFVNDTIEIITFDILSHNYLNKQNIPHLISDSFLSKDDYKEIQKKSYEIEQWYDIKELQSFLIFNHINLGQLTYFDSDISIAFWQTVGNVPLALAMSIYVWETPTQNQLIILLLIAIFGTIAQTSLNAALRRGEVSFLLPFDYLRLLWSILIGYFMFKDFPGHGLFIGGALIVFATSLMAYRESRKS